MQDHNRIILIIIFIMFFCVFSKMLCNLEESMSDSDLMFNHSMPQDPSFLKE